MVKKSLSGLTFCSTRRHLDENISFNFHLEFPFRSSDQQSLKRTSSFHAYYAQDTNKGKEDVVAQSGNVVPEMTSDMGEPGTTRVQFNVDDDEEDTKKNDEGEKTEIDMEAQFAGAID